MNYKQKISLHDAVVDFVNGHDATAHIATHSISEQCIRLSLVRFGNCGVAGYVQHFIGGVCVDTKEQALEYQHDVNVLVSMYVGAVSVL